MNAFSRFPGVSAAEDRASAAMDLPDALYAEQAEAEATLQELSDELSFVLWAEGRTDCHPHDLEEMRDEAMAMKAALRAYQATKNARQSARRAS